MAQKRSRKKKKIRQRRFFVLIALCITLLIGAQLLLASRKDDDVSAISLIKTREVARPAFDVKLIQPNTYSRPQTQLEKVNGIVIHYVGNPGTTAVANRNYFNELGKTHTTYASSHFVVGLEGEVIQCIPLKEIAYASNDRNNDTISIEVCHPDATGKFNDKTYDSLIELVAWLVTKYDLSKDDIIRHYDVTGKLCPLYYVKHEDAWEKLKNDVITYIKKEGQ